MSNLNPDNRALIIISSASQATFFVPIIKNMKHERKDCVILALNFQSQKRLREEGIQFKIPEDYIPKEICDQIDEKTVSFTTTWYKDYEDQLSYEGVSLGKMVEYEVYIFFLDALKSIVLANNVISQEKPDRILASTEKIPRAKHLSSAINSFEVLAKIRNIPLAKFHQKTRKDIESLVEPKLKASRDLARRILSRSKRWLLRELPRKFSRSTGNRIVFVDIPERVMPVIEQLEKDGECRVTILGSGQIKEYRVSNLEEKISEERVLLNKVKQNLEKNVKLRKRLSYNDICVYDVLEEAFSYIFSSRFIELVRYIESTNSMIHKEPPHVIVLMDDVTPVHRTIVSVAKNHDIPTLVIQHGVTAGDMGGLHAMPTIADKQAVWGEISKEWSVTRGVEPERLVITGNPRYDAYAKGLEFDVKKAMLDLNIDPSKGIITLATQPYSPIGSAHNPPRMNELLLRGVLNAMKEFPDKQLIIKLHPAEDDSLAKGVSEEMGLDPIIIKHPVYYSRLLDKILTMSDLMIVFNTGVGLEAMILDKPVIIINITGQPDAVPYASSGAAIGVYRQEDIAPAMRDALYDEEVRQRLAVNRKRFVYDYAYKQDGQASKRVAQLIKNMIKESPSRKDR